MKTTPNITWRAMLEAVPLRNTAAVAATRPDGSLSVTVAIQKTWWMVPPITWILQPRKEKEIALDAIGSRILEWCDGQRTVEDIIEIFAREYAFTFHEARVSVTNYLKSLIQRGVLAIEQPG